MSKFSLSINTHNRSPTCIFKGQTNDNFFRIFFFYLWKSNVSWFSTKERFWQIVHKSLDWKLFFIACVKVLSKIFFLPEKKSIKAIDFLMIMIIVHLFCFISIMKLYSFETKWIIKQTKSLGIFYSCLTSTKLYYRLLIRNGSTNFLHPRASTLNPNGKREKEKITGKKWFTWKLCSVQNSMTIYSHTCKE